ncbi:TPA: hypothetical protein R4193_004253 [Serratia marcescens]|uniref:hypothetical protein n=1 Tax=Serratia TaxID=613 RepID=UPI0006D9FB05|nr:MULTISPECIES: hypothetical protein [Serratia]EGT0502521.1 hypothetical protein [Serratia marcescens]EHT9829225.1 hypothetical protein [Serratia marcescens]EIU0970474.1 hypothetical protein [Serratia marcescens]EMB7754335.1 hypothetical protein [Serratia marcescens]MDP8630760.1 hypothetical protein [Serratia marcescens]
MRITINDSLGFGLYSSVTPDIINRSALCRIMGFDENAFWRAERKLGFERALKQFKEKAKKN